MTNTKTLKELVAQVRWNILSATTTAGSGHPSSSLSATDLMVGLMFSGIFRAHLGRPHDPDNDRLIFSKGHAAPLLYALYAAAGKVMPRELKKLRMLNSPLEGHPTPEWPFTEAPTGSLGQGLSIGAGEALAAKMQGRNFRTYVLLGDGEMAEGNVWEALQVAAHEKLDNLIAILDVNRLGQSGPTALGWNTKAYAARVASFGWKTIVVNGHDLPAIQRAYAAAVKTKGRPTMIIAKTFKGKGVPEMENKEGWHGQVLSPGAWRRAQKTLGPVNLKIRGEVARPAAIVLPPAVVKAAQDPQYALGSEISPRQAAGRALVRLAPAYPQLVVLDGDVKNSTQTDAFAAKFPKRFLEGGIAEQNIVGLANGLAHRGLLPVAATFAAFWTRAFDQLRMMHYAGVHGVFLGTHAGVHIGEDGASQMGLEDIAMFRTLPNATVLYPSDAYATERLMDLALRQKHLVYVRLTRAALPVIHTPARPFRIGGSATMMTSKKDATTIVAAGVTLHEALAAAKILMKRKIRVRVIDLYSIHPIDAATLRKAVRETGRLVVVEDHVAAGGIADAVRSALGREAGAVISLAVRTTPHSGRPAQLLKDQGIDAAAIIRTVMEIRR